MFAWQCRIQGLAGESCAINFSVPLVYRYKIDSVRIVNHKYCKGRNPDTCLLTRAQMYTLNSPKKNIKYVSDLVFYLLCYI